MISIYSGMSVFHVPWEKHSRAISQRIALRGDVLEGAIPIVAIERLAAEIIDDIKISIAIVVEVAPHSAQAQPFVSNATLLGNIGERAITVVVIEARGGA